MHLPTENRQSTIRWAFVFAIPLLVALFVRTAPLLEGGDRLRHQCITEDGYLMLTIARNVALGNGFSIAGGEIATNGTQPLTTLLFAGCIKLAGGDRITGLYPVVAAQVLWSIAGAIALYVCTRRLLYRGPHANTVALLAALLWFISPTSLQHMQNGLETGLYALLILLSVAAYDLFRPKLLTTAAWGACLALGVILGLTFLARNDACFLIAVLLLVHLASMYRSGQLKRGLTQCFTIGLISIAVASPWLWFNVTQFGHIVPVSGRAEAHNVVFAHNLRYAFIALLENLTLLLRVPGSLEASMTMTYASVVILLGLALIAARHRHWLAANFSAGTGILAAFVGALFIYYALFFGMPGFLGRYFFPITILSAIFLAALFGSSLTHETRPIANRHSTIGKSPRLRPVVLPLLALALFITIAFNIRMYRNGKNHLHSQVVAWVDANVPENVYVGATQTGTLGYYHDRTINLDGKVNPIAFEYRKQHRIAEYARTTNVQYIVDWVGHAAWAKLPEFSPYYELIVEDHEKNLAVLRRRQESALTRLQRDHLSAIQEWIDDILIAGLQHVPIANYVTPDLLFAWTGEQPSVRMFVEDYAPWFKLECTGSRPPEIALVAGAGLQALPLLRPLLDNDCVAEHVHYEHPMSSTLGLHLPRPSLQNVAAFLVESALGGKVSFAWSMSPESGESECENYAAAYAAWIDRCYDASRITLRCPDTDVPAVPWLLWSNPHPEFAGARK